MSTENTKTLLIAQMKRVIEILEDGSKGHYHIAEIDKKLHEIRRDSVRYVNEMRRGWWK